ncbi:1-(5-phosphoribosyl)-5-[(5-phosphoribosylamino)methylideneamino]imidazole-4-carboxamide isomerase [Effusibacillus lacus]|uniref:1-(5-phosphoribosyl)-5-[(5-phosphoribosylamino)methylideneamino] imidazole-4-carboxamide isomerase n=1 Tax=Effusibacillus lacus TaxID=1348429 RepID=A0A292YDZ8_9BACL|nr:1-(5-phosphoribosyl)-5-[(5-phosphoribosylamino)methylideneamino]imidazole-4-carboxamide isomerase [Effusibacillus lacus]TCS74201.1 1-(5-phosphoribosyl)-5-[(5-phosphoribosylamino)methylideneamino] imidazole-4-carboxamide isomerase [Effusibacillus lacus]GAX90802.1 1-(5-phosphoribosyl)-5-((5-phosphoribosylamino) methylideneamino)imidazole-4-carboxamide isomerase [Effusibacillus lacus]
MSQNTEFVLYPAIDILGGKAVRLLRGDYGEKTVYHENPAEVARQWVEQGAEFIHVVDLDGAKEGSQQNRPVIEEIVKRVPVPVQVGGGIRTGETLEALFSLGVARCILGTAAVREPFFVKQAVTEYGEKVVIGIDAKNGWVAVNGWLETSDISAIELGRELKQWGATRVIFTDIARDGTLEGPNLAANIELAEETGLKVIASGGVKETSDLLKLAKYRNAGVAGAIIGKALYTGNIDLTDAINRVRKELAVDGGGA